MIYCCLPTMSVCQMISTYRDDLLRKLAERYQALSGKHNILIYREWQAFLSLTFVQGILHNDRAVYTLSPPPQPKGVSFAPGYTAQSLALSGSAQNSEKLTWFIAFQFSWSSLGKIEIFTHIYKI